MIDETPSLSGKIRVAFEWASAPVLTSGVPLHRGQRAERRLKYAINQVMTLKIIPLTIILTAN
jgi:hypothetical protein